MRGRHCAHGGVHVSVRVNGRVSDHVSVHVSDRVSDHDLKGRGWGVWVGRERGED